MPPDIIIETIGRQLSIGTKKLPKKLIGILTIFICCALWTAKNNKSFAKQAALPSKQFYPI